MGFYLVIAFKGRYNDFYFSSLDYAQRPAMPVHGMTVRLSYRYVYQVVLLFPLSKFLGEVSYPND